MKTRAITWLRVSALLLLSAVAPSCGDGPGGGGGSGPNEPPVAVIGGPYSSNTGTISFDASKSSDPNGDALTYRWDFGDGSEGTGATTSHTYQAVGSYTVQLTVSDARGLSTPAQTAAQVSNVPPVVTAGADGSVPAGAPYALSVTFADATSEGSPWSYVINWGDGSSNTTGTQTSVSTITSSHEFPSEASYKVKITVTDHRGAAGSDSLAVTATAPVIIAAGDIAQCGPTHLADEATADLLDGLEGVVVPIGDNAYSNGTLDEYNDCYAPTWGRHKARTRPIAGNHDYNTPGATGYFDYFGAQAGDPTKGYYSFTLGSWFVIVINTGTDSPPNYAAGSPQEQWLRSELASHSQQCVLAMWHHPRFSTVLNRDPIRPEVKAIWDALYQYGADLVLNGHDHAYQRFAPQTPDGTADATYGIREIAVGTGGGENLYQFTDPPPAGSNIEVRNNQTRGVLKVTLRAGSYDWRFIPALGGTFTDAGSGTCHGRP